MNKVLTRLGIVAAAVCWFFLDAGQVDAGWRYYGATYYQGAKYYGECHYNGYSYRPGYWYWYEEPQVLTAYVYPVYLTTSVAQYVPVVAQSPAYATGPLTTVKQVAVQATTQTTATVAADPGTSCHAQTQALEKRLAELEAALVASRRADPGAELLRRLDSIERRLAAPAGQAPAAPVDPMGPAASSAPARPKQQAAANDAERFQSCSVLLVDRCADCHHETEATKRKDGFSMFRGGAKTDAKWGGDLTILAMNNEQLDDIAARVASTVKSEQMPPEKSRKDYPGLDVAQQAEVRWWVGKLKAARVAQAGADQGRK